MSRHHLFPAGSVRVELIKPGDHVFIPSRNCPFNDAIVHVDEVIPTLPGRRLLRVSGREGRALLTVWDSHYIDLWPPPAPV